MHIVLLLLALFGGGIFWWYRLKMLSNAAGDIIDIAGTFRGYIRRRQMRRKAEESPAAAIEDPVHAAATVILAILADDGRVTEALTAAVRNVLLEISSAKEADEALIYAEWACRQVGDTVTIIDKATPLLRQRLNNSEKHELIDMLRRAVAAGQSSSADYSNRLKRLTQKLGLQVD